MLLKYLYDDTLAQASYLVGCPATGTALVVDPARDVQQYLDLAGANDLRITGVAETHIHADYTSGGHELAHRTGATLYISGHGRDENPALAYDFADDVDVQYVHEGDVIMVGNVRLDVLHTPGHTPEHICYKLTDNQMPEAMGIFSGDCLFVGDMGRPDLLEESLKVANTREAGARQQFANMRRLNEMRGHLQIWPGHGAGSACGKALGAIPSTTLGYERLVNPAFQFKDESAFVDWLISGQPEAPHYFAQMKAINRVGPALLETLPEPLHLVKEDFERALADGDLVIDARDSEVYARKHVPGVLHVPGTSTQFSTYAGWYIDYEKPTYLLAEKDDISRLIRELRAIGVDNIPGYFTPEVIEGDLRSIREVSVQEALEFQSNGAVILDVRGAGERDEQHIPGSQFIPMGKVPERLDELPRDRQIITQCGGGVRSMVVASLLKNQGFDVVNLQGGIDAWIEAGLVLNKA